MKISPLKHKLLAMSDEELERTIQLIQNEYDKKRSATTGKCWFDSNLCGLSTDGLERLAELEQQNVNRGRNVDRKQLRYLRQLSKMRLNDCVPPSFRNFSDYKALFRRLQSFCIENDIPAEIVSAIIPPIAAYIKTGHMRPILLVGEKGCGKTTGLRMLVEEALNMPTDVVKVSQLEGSHGLTGDNGSYQSADAGRLVHARIANNSMLVAYIFDEIDKTVQSNTHENTADSLLPVTDESVTEIYDEYIQDKIIGLEHCPLFFTANDVKKINPILLDRMMVIRFPEANSMRIKSIVKKYVESQFLSNDLYSEYVKFDFSAMNDTIDLLLTKYDIHSIRKHQQVVERVFGEALNMAFLQENNEIVEVNSEMFRQAMLDVVGTEKRKIGF